MKNKKIYFYILVVVSFLVISYLLAQKVFQNDTYYSIKIGESIFENGIDMKDHFSFIEGLAYSYPHWLFDTFIYIMYSIGGFFLIYLSTIILGFILLITLYNCSIKLGNNKYISYLLIVFFSFFLNGYFTARAQIFSYTFFVIILYSLEMLRKTNKKRYFVYLFLSSWFIANMHAAVWPFIFALFLPFIVQDIIYLIVNKFNIKFIKDFNFELEKSNLKTTLIAFLLCGLTGLLTPNFLVPFTYFIKTINGISLNHINEHTPITIKSYGYVYYFVFATIIIILNKKSKVRLSELFLLLGLFILAFYSIKNISLLIILSVLTFCRLFSKYDFSTIEPQLWNNIFMSILLLLFLIAPIVHYNTYSKKNYVDKSLYPVEASDYIVENLDYKNIKLFNQYDYGSYLLYRDIPVFIDSRADLYLKEFNKDCTVFEDYFDAKNNYEMYFRKYEITHLLLRKNTPLYYTITERENYKVLYNDYYFALLSLGD